MFNSIFIKKFKIFSKFPNYLRCASKREKSNACFVKHFEKSGKTMHFLNFSKKVFENFGRLSQDFPKIFVFHQNSRKITAKFVKSFEIYAKIMHFS